MKTLPNIVRIILIVILSILFSFNLSAQNEYIYLKQKRLDYVEQKIKENDKLYVDALNRLIREADKELEKDANPVTNKKIVPPSGSKNDYLSIAPYAWPDTNKANGLPWKQRDGIVNPDTRIDENTDQKRLSNLQNATQKLSLAYYFTNEKKYADKAKNLIRTWFITRSTRVNPHARFAQGIPGQKDGNWFGIIEWEGTWKVLTAIEILKNRNQISSSYVDSMDEWFTEWVDWLMTSELGKKAESANNNHANWYNYQLIGILTYLGRKEEAKKQVEKATKRIINEQITPDGRQPAELRRTKSLHYSSFNLRAMSFVAELGLQLGVDLWKYETRDGKSIKKAAEFLVPYAEGKKEWEWEEITGADFRIERDTKPTLSILESLFSTQLVDPKLKIHESLTYIHTLVYPPVSTANQTPTIKLTSPSNFQNFELGYNIDLLADASDPDGTVRVEFHVDDALHAGDPGAPFDRDFKPTKVGKYKITAIAIDNLGATESTSVTVKVVNSNAPRTYTEVTDESKNVSITQLSDIAFGINGSFVYLTNQDKDLVCDANTFGSDPTPGFPKKCYIRNSADYTPPRTFTEAGKEKDQIQVSEELDVAFGVNNTFIYLNNQKRDVTCDANTFGEDPVLGYSKRCFTRPSANYDAPDDGYTLVNNEKETVEINETVDVAFGVNGKFEYLYNQSSDLVCNSETFGFDPQKGYAKKCFTRPSVVTSINDLEDKASLTVFPNPSQDGIFHLSETREWEIVNIDGQVIQQDRGDVINLSDRSKGVYFLKSKDEVIRIIHD